jgi:N-acetylglucosaminyldiphosphoundecaprenol N-acetyl-beta-D-mannosaminyltransferase
MRKVLIILSVPIDDITMDEALLRLETFILEGRANGKSHQIATINADFVVKARDDPELRGLLRDADMCTADGMPLVWGARLLGVPLTGRVTGADLVPALAQVAAARGYTMYLLGAAPGVALRASQVLCARYPGLQIVGVDAPPYGSVLEMDASIVEKIHAAQPDILLVAFGNPKQEKWIGMHARDLPVPVMIGVGGTLDFIAGVTRRAPAWMQRSGLEWIYRLLQEPRRLWKRYFVDLFGFGTFFVRQWWLMRNSRGGAGIWEYGTVGDAVVTEPGFASAGSAANLASGPGAATIVSGANDAAAARVTPGATAPMEPAPVKTQGGSSPAAPHSEDRPATALGAASVGAEVLPTAPAPQAGPTEAPQPYAKPAGGRIELVTQSAPADSTGKRVLRVSGRIDASQRMAFTGQLEEALNQSPCLIIDLSAAEFLDSSAVGALVAAAKRAREAGGEVSLAAVPPAINRVLALLRLDHFFETYPDVNTALRLTQAARDAPAPLRPQDRGRWLVVAVPSRLDASTAPAVLAQGTGWLCDHPHLVLDFSATNFLASAGLAAMIKLNRAAGEAGGELRAAACTPDVLRVLKLTKLDAVIKLYPDIEAATCDGVAT